MSTLTLTLTDEQVDRYNLQAESLTLDQLVEKIKTDVTREAVRKCQSIAADSDLAAMTLDDINAEIQAVRDAKNSH